MGLKQSSQFPDVKFYKYKKNDVDYVNGDVCQSTDLSALLLLHLARDLSALLFLHLTQG